MSAPDFSDPPARPSTPANAAETPVPVAIQDDESLARVRHSLRTPLNQIIGYCELMLEESLDHGYAALETDLQKIHTAGQQLLALINDTLAPWKFEAGAIDLDALRLEMRTPLNLIVGYSELCQEVAEEESHQELLPDLQKITGAAKNLLSLFESISFPTRIEVSPQPTFSPSAPLGRRFSAPAQRADRDDLVERAVQGAAILLADDNEMNRDMLCRRLERLGAKVTEAENGREAVSTLQAKNFDLILLDMVMPEMNGFETLQQIKANPHWRDIPVIMLSALDELEKVIQCIEAGADDYITKPFNPVLLTARISSALDKRRLRALERSHWEMLEIERQKSETLLLNILPRSILDRLKQGENMIADTFPDATVLVANISDFSQATASLPPDETVDLLNDLYSQFDWLAELHTVEKIKTVADTYIAAAGLPVARPDHAPAAAEVALEMLKIIKKEAARRKVKINLRIGLCSGPVMAGIVGRKRFIYDLWGETMHTACLLEDLGRPGFIRVSQSFYEKTRDKYLFEPADRLTLRGRGELDTYYLTGRNPRQLSNLPHF